MPQMSPLNWITLFIYFMIIFMTFNILNYFSITLPNSKNNVWKWPAKFNWKW